MGSGLLIPYDQHAAHTLSVEYCLQKFTLRNRMRSRERISSDLFMSGCECKNRILTIQN